MCKRDIGLTPSSMVFMSDLLDTMIDEIDYTIYTTDDTELIKLLEYEKLQITKAFTRLSNFITIRRYNENEK